MNTQVSLYQGGMVSIPLDRRSVLVGVLIALIGLASALFAPAPSADASALDKSDCPSGKICLWSGPTYGGQQSFWNAWETGCHGLENIDPTSAYNNTNNRNATFPGVLGSPLGPGQSFQFLNPYTGSLCID